MDWDVEFDRRNPERLAALEAEVKAVKENVNEIKVMQSESNKAIIELKEQLIKHKGFLGGIVFAVSAVWALIVVSIQFLLKR